MLNIPAAPSIEGATHLHSGKVRDLYELPGRRAADGRQRPDLDLRLRARHDDPRQGRDPDPDVAVVVRPARRPGAQPRLQHRRAGRRTRPGGGVRAARDVPRRVRRPRLPHRLRPARLPRDAARSAASRCRPGSRTAAACRSRSSRRPPRPSSATTTRTSRTTPSPATVGAERAAELRDLTLAVYARAEGIARERGIILADTKLEFGAPTRTARRCSPTRCSPPTPPASGRPPSGSPAAPSRRTTSRSCATGRSRPSPAGTARPARRRRRCRRRSSSAPAAGTSRPTSC